MPKINVYLPDDLAAAVRAAGVRVSPVCQQALAAAAGQVNSARRAISAIRDPGFDPGRHPVLAGRVEDRMTLRLAGALRLARRAGGGRTGTGQLLLGVLGEGHNLGVRLLQAVDVDTGELTAALRQADRAEPAVSPPPAAKAGPAAGAKTGPPAGAKTGPAASAKTGPPPGARTGPRSAEETGGAAGPMLGPDLTRPAWRAVATALEAAVDLGHNYLGCEHLVLGLIAETGSVAGRLLREAGADPAAARTALGPILAGDTHGRQATAAAGPEALGEVLRRLDALEARVASLGTVSG